MLKLKLAPTAVVASSAVVVALSNWTPGPQGPGVLSGVTLGVGLGSARLKVWMKYMVCPQVGPSAAASYDKGSRSKPVVGSVKSWPGTATSTV